jgi:nucleotide-binding universal stress UspA family protein
VRDYYADEAETALRPARRRLLKTGLSPLVRYTVGRPAIEITAVADKDKLDLLVVGSHGHSALGGMLLGSVTNEVLVHTKRATLIVRGKAKRYADSLRVGIAVDGGPYGVAALKYVLRHAELFGAAASISLIHVVPTYDLVGIPSVAGFAPPAFSPAEVRSMQDKAYEAAMRPVRKLLKKQAGIKATEVRLAGHPGDELSSYAKKKLDVLAMGSHGYGALKGTVLGSVATRVVAHCQIPLLLIRSATR